MLSGPLVGFEMLRLLLRILGRVDGRLRCCRLLGRGVGRVASVGELGSAAPTVLQSFEFFVGVSQVLVLWLVGRGGGPIRSIAAIVPVLALAFCRSGQALLQERYRRVMRQV